MEHFAPLSLPLQVMYTLVTLQGLPGPDDDDDDSVTWSLMMMMMMMMMHHSVPSPADDVHDGNQGSPGP